MRIAQFLANAGICSRKEASRRITQGRVIINNVTATHQDQLELAQPLPAIYCDGIMVTKLATPQYWLFNKPVGVDCRLITERPDSLIHLIDHLPRLFPVGRLDKDSHGLMLLTNDGPLCHQLMHPDFAHTKRYHVQVATPIDNMFIKSMASGVQYKDVITSPCTVTRLGINRFEIILTQGLNRQIRRMSQALGRHVIDLQRVAIGLQQLDDLSVGELRAITRIQAERLRQ